jgi:hypothetical protein
MAAKFPLSQKKITNNPTEGCHDSAVGLELDVTMKSYLFKQTYKYIQIQLYMYSQVKIQSFYFLSESRSSNSHPSNNELTHSGFVNISLQGWDQGLAEVSDSRGGAGGDAALKCPEVQKDRAGGGLTGLPMGMLKIT